MQCKWENLSWFCIDFLSPSLCLSPSLSRCVHDGKLATLRDFGHNFSLLKDSPVWHKVVADKLKSRKLVEASANVEQTLAFSLFRSFIPFLMVDRVIHKIGRMLEKGATPSIV